MKKEKRSLELTQVVKQWLSGWFYTPVDSDEVIIQPKKSIATTHMRLLSDALFKPNLEELLNDLICKIQSIDVPPLAMIFMSMAMMQLADAQHVHDANLTFVDPYGGHYRYLYQSSYPELTQCAEQFKDGAAGVIATALNFTNATVFYEGMRVLPTQMIAMLVYHTGSNATLSEMNKLIEVVVPAINKINQAAETARSLQIGLPIAIVGFILAVVGTAAVARRVCHRRKLLYLDISSNMSDAEGMNPPTETTKFESDL